jgi:hypothetical protein
MKVIFALAEEQNNNESHEHISLSSGTYWGRFGTLWKRNGASGFELFRPERLTSIITSS